MDNDDAKAHLLLVLKARGIPLDIEGIERAFEEETTKKEAKAWIEEYLGDITLLTRDEIDLYKAIGDATKLELSSASHDVVPLLDRDIKEAIAALKSSTSAIENHARALEAQKDALMQLRSTKSNVDGPSRMSSKYAQEKSNLNFAVCARTLELHEDPLTIC